MCWPGRGALGDGEPRHAQARFLLRPFIYTPVHGPWLNMAAIEFTVLSHQALNRFFADKAGRRTLESPAKRAAQVAKPAI